MTIDVRFLEEEQVVMIEKCAWWWRREFDVVLSVIVVSHRLEIAYPFEIKVY